MVTIGIYRGVSKDSRYGVGYIPSETDDALHRRVDGALKGLGQGL
jgi:hypothetical protein